VTDSHTMETPVAGLVSAIIPAYNASAYIADAIDSVLAQTYPAVEIIVTNDGSTDRTPDVLASYAGSITVVDQPNRGLAAARNRAVRAARGEYLAFLDADDVWHPGKIARQVDVLCAQPQHVLVHTKADYIDANGHPVVVPESSWVGTIHGDCTHRLLDHNAVTVSSVLMRRQLLDAEPFRPGMQGCEDWELWLRLSLKGPFAYISEPLTTYRLHEANMSSGTMPMLRASIAAIKTFLQQHLDADIRHRAERLLLDQFVVLAHYEYERGSLEQARSLFLKGRAVLGLPEFRRLLISLIPGDIRPAIRRRRMSIG
jgi:glycosyltransferase involved in cell wall biosynthesis